MLLVGLPQCEFPGCRPGRCSLGMFNIVGRADVSGMIQLGDVYDRARVAVLMAVRFVGSDWLHYRAKLDFGWVCGRRGRCVPGPHLCPQCYW